MAYLGSQGVNSMLRPGANPGGASPLTRSFGHRPSMTPLTHQQQQQQQQMQPFGAQQDPFGQSGGMMMSPFGMFGGGGGGLMGGMFGQMNAMMQDMNSMMLGGGGSMQGMAGGPGSGMMMLGSSSGGGGGFSCQSMTFSSSMGQDGQMRSERFSSSTVGDMSGKMREVQQAYSNTDTGMNKMSMERQMDGRGRKLVKESSSVTGEERQTDLYRGMDEEQYPQFEQDWNRRAVPRLPQHAQGMQHSMLGNGSAGSGYPARGQVQQQQALPVPSQQQQQQYQQQQPGSASGCT
mmetsp:Transcript_66485/g.168470  ORF Transcript_66485/g.168470 Transcript_66485/m.168470 type:complete len:291 (-) Transcript_66485:115-987(-)